MTDTGIVVLAQNNSQDNYVIQACLLAMSVKLTNPNLPISIITNDSIDDEYIQFFDKIIPIPFGDSAKNTEWKVENRWKIYHASPYERTIVMDTDMLILQDISSWIDFLSNYKMYFTSNVYTYRGELVTSDFYRKTFTANKLPNLYVGFHYFEKGEFAHEYYKWMELVTNNWELFYGQYAKEFYPGRCSMDVTASIVSKILDCDEDITNKIAKFPSFTHMKPKIQNWIKSQSSWQDTVGTYISNDCSIKLGNYKQIGILHYTENDFIDKQGILDVYRRCLNV